MVSPAGAGGDFTPPSTNIGAYNSRSSSTSSSSESESGSVSLEYENTIRFEEVTDSIPESPSPPPYRRYLDYRLMASSASFSRTVMSPLTPSPPPDYYSATASTSSAFFASDVMSPLTPSPPPDYDSATASTSTSSAFSASDVIPPAGSSVSGTGGSEDYQLYTPDGATRFLEDHIHFIGAMGRMKLKNIASGFDRLLREGVWQNLRIALNTLVGAGRLSIGLANSIFSQRLLGLTITQWAEQTEMPPIAEGVNGWYTLMRARYQALALEKSLSMVLKSSK